LLGTHPHIPTQNAEKDLGYDVEFEIKKGGFVKSLFLQHKVAAYASTKAGRNAKFFDHQAGPYYRFPIDNDQHNTLCHLNKTKGDAFYCAPIFRGSVDLASHWRAQTIGAHSLLLDPLLVGHVIGGKHNITYSPSGGNATLHSDPQRFERVFRANIEGFPELKSREITTEYVAELGEDLLDRLSNFPGHHKEFIELRKRKPIEVAQVVLGRVYQVTWLLLR